MNDVPSDSDALEEPPTFALYEGRERLGHFTKIDKQFHAFAQNGRSLGIFRKAKTAARAISAEAITP